LAFFLHDCYELELIGYAIFDSLAARPHPRDGGAEEFRGNPTIGPHLKVWPEVKNGSSDKKGAPERLRCETIQEEVS